MNSPGYVSEVFHSIQGEGLYCGVMQVFLRLAGCSLSCSYCDTGGSAGRSGECVLYGLDEMVKVPNPVDAGELVSFIQTLLEILPGVHSLSVTGGEPLEQPEFLQLFLRLFQTAGLPVYLETNGLEVEAAKILAPLVDIVSLDIKLPSLCGGGELFGKYEAVLPVFGKRELFCKIVLAPGFDADEYGRALSLLSRFDNRLPLIIQPATSASGAVEIEPSSLLSCYGAATEKLQNVRLIPQCHRLLGLR
ncbi:MAG: 7-carboxy-7-deazaguanine synthase QueE [Candidatus Krumholzibacteriota bacterium]|nr:7-carboxy-7-deazaguanine synthase QueE [Candidatus Krumholzibacteriota bacterium]